MPPSTLRWGHGGGAAARGCAGEPGDGFPHEPGDGLLQPRLCECPHPWVGGGTGDRGPPPVGQRCPLLPPALTLCPPLPPGEAEAGILGAAARQTAALLHLPGGQKVVCRGEGATPTPRGGTQGCPRVLTVFVSPPPPSQLTFVDFLMFDVLDQNCIFAPRCLEPYSNLRAFMERFGVSVMGRVREGAASEGSGGGLGGGDVPPPQHPFTSHRRWKRWRRT